MVFILVLIVSYGGRAITTEQITFSNEKLCKEASRAIEKSSTYASFTVLGNCVRVR